MIRKELVDLVSAQVAKEQGRSIQKTTIGLVVDAVFEQIATVLEAGDNFRIKNFGTFLTKVKPARTARNPKTGESIQLEARRVAVFKVSKQFKLSA